MTTTTPTTTIDTLTALAPILTAAGWPVTLEYPGHLLHVQEPASELSLEIRIGFEGPDVSSALQIQYYREAGAVCTGSMQFKTAGHFASVDELARFVVAVLNTADVER